MIEIKTTGLEDYLDGEGGTSNIKALILGRPGSGKTRGASFWKRPFLCDFEDGRAVVADRGIPYVRIRTLAEATEALAYIKREVGKPSRKFDTVMVDTADGFQKISVRERLKKVGRTQLEAFEGDYDAVNNPVETFIAGLLELDINVVVNIHVQAAGKIKVKDEDKKPALGEDTINMVQGWEVALLGKLREQISGWFDLVGLMENEWGVEDGKKVIRRRIRWQPIPEVPFLKDRLYAFPETTPVNFADSDYTQLVDFIAKKAKGLKPSESVEVVGTAPAVAPSDIKGGPVTPDPSGVLPKPRGAAKKTEKAKADPKPVQTPAASEPTGEQAVSTVQEVLGGEVVATEGSSTSLDFLAEAEASNTKDEIRAIWEAAKVADVLTPALKARLTVLAQKR